VDHPPLSIFILAAARLLFGNSLLAIRFFSSLAGALLVFLAGMIARELGGKRIAQVIACISVIIAGTYLSMNSFFSMNAFDYLVWALGAYVVVIIIKNNKPKLWIVFGVIAGLGLLNKYSMGFFITGLLIGLLLTSHRKQLINKSFWLGALIALVILLPHIIWQIVNKFPTLEFMRNASQYKNVDMSPLSFLLGQVFTMNSINTPIWLLGIYYYFFHKKGKQYRLFGWLFVAVFIIMVTSKAKLYYFAPAFSIVFASGAVLIEELIHKIRWNWFKPIVMAALIILMIISGIMIAPFAIPVLPVETFLKYAEFIGWTPPREEVHELSILPQHLADMFGWENMVATVAQVYNELSPEEQSNCIIYVYNYGEAGAIDFFGEKYGLPKATCAHNNYWLWGPGDKTGEVAIYIGYNSNVQENMENLKQYFKKVEHAATIKCKYCMPYENNKPIFICHGPNFSYKKEWPNFRFYI